MCPRRFLERSERGGGRRPERGSSPPRPPGRHRCPHGWPAEGTVRTTLSAGLSAALTAGLEVSVGRVRPHQPALASSHRAHTRRGPAGAGEGDALPSCTVDMGLGRHRRQRSSPGKIPCAALEREAPQTRGRLSCNCQSRVGVCQDTALRRRARRPTEAGLHPGGDRFGQGFESSLVGRWIPDVAAKDDSQHASTFADDIAGGMRCDCPKGLIADPGLRGDGCARVIRLHLGKFLFQRLRGSSR